MRRVNFTYLTFISFAIIVLSSSCGASKGFSKDRNKGKQQKTGYRIEIKYGDNIDQTDFAPVILYLEKGDYKIAIDSAFFNNKRVAVLSSEKALEAGEYSLLSDGKSIVQLFLSDKDSILNESFILNPDIIDYKGLKENRDFAEFQNLIFFEWEKYKNADEFLSIFNKLIKRCYDENPGNLLSYHFAYQFPEQTQAPLTIILDILNDPRVLNTSILYSIIKRQLKALELSPSHEIIEFADSFIASSNISEIKAYIAYQIFDFFYKSNVMGHESVCVHIADNYFINKKLIWPNSEGLAFLRMFADFNRSSMIGMEATDLILLDSDYNEISTNSIDADYKIIYFYDDNCSVCKRESPLLMEFMTGNNIDGNIAVIAVFTERDEMRFFNYLRDTDSLKKGFPDNVRWYDLWDPAETSEFHKLYSVLSTPQMIVTNSLNTIKGKNLSTVDLTKLLNNQEAMRSELWKFFDLHFADMLDGSAESELLMRVTLEDFYNNSKNNPELFEEVFYELYSYFTIIKPDTAKYILEKYIHG